ncbi:sigma-E factor negative regulatory protein [Lysobacter sp. K5869]|uniref:sigma-E factor negative regulatory protein n=1 Tax=Lysobacter sp. K5869 TaxID=2820808 RepID=UPI001C063BF5|nr:sigma-E factor negative regulatory protein [Lysobacter sp. K5869]QWP76039.1 sigma-E factor negative regulatory protein [Lysobacter sp. K5869]
MTSTPLHGDERETLSALFDGELDDGARFALKRLGHDAQWREACGRWQLCGDVLRRRAHGAAEPAPGFAAQGFAERVAAAIQADAALQASQAAASAAPAATEVKPRKAAGSRRGWFGGAALAASVAVAALFVARPFSDETPAGAGDPAQVAAQAAQPTQPAPQPVPAPAPQAVAANTPAETGLTSADATGLAAGAAVAVAELPRRLNERRSRGQSQRAAVRASERQSQEAPLQVAAAGGASMVADARAGSAANSGANPFRPQQSEAPASRPWPRAALPNYPSNSAYTASYGSSAVSPSFYPFEPAQEAAARTRPPVQEPQPQQP